MPSLRIAFSKYIKILFIFISATVIYGCGSDSDPKPEPKVKVPLFTPDPTPDPDPDPEPDTISITGSGVKGPLAAANVTVYAINPDNENFFGTIVGTGNTDASAQIENLSLPFPLSPPYILEISATEGTTDITTGQYPVIEVMKTLLTDEMLSGGQQIFATPLTDMTVSLIFKNADSNVAPYTGNNDGTVTDAEILAAIPVAQEQVKSTLGFGLEDDVDLFNTPPLINESTDSADEQASTAAYRSAVEALTAVVYEIKQLSGDSEITTDSIVDDLAADLSDGTIDGAVDGVETESYPETALEVLEQDPATLPIPNDPEGRTVSDVKELILEETEQTGNTETDTTAFADSEAVIELAPAETSPDIDGDGVLNSEDAYPEDAAADSDFDQDGMPDVAYIVVDGARTTTIDTERSDNDDDNDGVDDDSDAFPNDATETTDTDLDGIGNNVDTDDDNDSVLDDADDFPFDSTRSNAVDEDNDSWPVGQDPDDSDANNPGIDYLDSDGDGQADTGGLAADNDDDNDGVADVDDVFPLDAAESKDLDMDGIGDNSDTDIDGDNVANADDLFPYDGFASIDTDADGIANYYDEDDDGDSLADETEILLGTDTLNNDSDGDGVFDNVDALPLDPTERFDTDKDSVGNNTDNCPLVANTFQMNSDDDSFGDACDTDDDNDGVLDADDDFPLDASKFDAVDADNDGWPTEQDSDDNDAAVPSETFVDTDGDGLADSGGLTPDSDDDNDGVEDADDAFALDVNEWLDTDSDGVGNNADLDDDNDQYSDADEIAVGSDPLDASSKPADFDGDFIADVSDDDIDNDGVLNANDAFDYDATESVDTDGDGVGNNSDPDIDGDGVANGDDSFPLDASETVDTDNDGKGDNADTDIDGDGVNNASDAFPMDASESVDTDLDGIGNNADLDDDGDKFTDADEIAAGTNPLSAASVPADLDGDFISDATDTDIDGDGVLNADDLFPTDATESADTDGDGAGNNADTDDDNDGYSDEDELAAGSDPLLATDVPADMDGDFISDATDTDIDGDGVLNADDAFPNDATETTDTDADGTGNNADTDDDGDGFTDEDETTAGTDPLLATDVPADMDGDFISDATDLDIDGDGVLNLDDVFPMDPSEFADADADGTGNNADTDDDNDGFSDTDEIAAGTDPLLDSDVPADLDGDFVSDATDTDIDGDGTLNTDDAFPNDATETTDTDADGTGNNADTDDDGDGFTDADETAAGTDPLLSSSVPADLDGDFISDATDTDIDGDGALNTDDAFPNDATETTDTDADGTGNNADTDDDGDGFTDADETAAGTDPLLSSSVPADLDGDFISDATDTDIDGDGTLNVDDVFPTDATETTDTDSDTVGNNADNCPAIANEDQLDTDNNGIGDVCDGYSFDLNGRWLIKQEYSQTGVDGQCSPEPVEAEIVVVTMTDDALHIVDQDNAGIEGEGINGTVNLDGTFSFNDGSFVSTDGLYDSASDTFAFSFTEENVGDACTEAANITATRVFEVNEQAAMVGGVTWFEGDTYEENGEIIKVYFDKGDITEGVEEVITFYDSDLGDWVVDAEPSADFLVTDAGIVNDPDLFTADGYGADGETLTLISSEKTLLLDFEKLDIEGFPLTTILDEEYATVIAESVTFSAGAKAYHSSITQQDESYGFWCDANWHVWFNTNLVCDNAIFVVWDPVTPTPAETMNDIVNMNTTPVDQLVGGIWVGADDFKNVQAYLVSDNGEITGANLNVIFVENPHNVWNPAEIANTTVISPQVGSNTVYRFTVPEWIHHELERDDEYRHIFLVEDSELESGMTIVRSGNYYPAGSAQESGIFFNDTAKADIEAAFNYADTDGDELPDSIDPDQDNDGVLNEDDAFPLDDTEWSDLDGDGTGDNADIDRDGDGVANDVDLAPEDADISAAQTFSVAELKAQYLQIISGGLAEPSIKVGYIGGAQYNFTAGMGEIITHNENFNVSYSLTNDELVMTVDMPAQNTMWLEPWQLVERGIVSQQAADDFVNANGGGAVDVIESVVGYRWYLVGSDATTQTFFETTVTEYSFVEAWVNDDLLGQGVANVALESTGSMTLTDVASLTVSAFTEVEFTDLMWALPATLDEFSGNGNTRLASDIATFNSDYSGTTHFNDAAFTWSVVDGDLVLTYPNGGTVTMTRLQDLANIDEVIVVTESAGLKTSRYQLITEFSEVTIDPLMNQFAMNSFALTNPDQLDEQGNVHSEEVFGYRIESGGTVTRFWDGDFDLNNYKSGWDTWQWQWGDYGSVQMSAKRSEWNGTYDDCNLDEWGCNPLRKRTWVPLKEVGNRVYVLEFEQWNDNQWNFDAEPMWYTNIAGRVVFYETYDLGLDADSDGISDMTDDDMDGDGIANTEDAFPLNSGESADLDGDGIGDNSDWDKDGDGVDNDNDAFPLDDTEWSDIDGDGEGDNTDVDRDGDGVNNDVDLAPEDADITAAMTFTEAELNANYIYLSASHTVEPTFQLGTANGYQYSFAGGFGENVTSAGTTSFSYTLVNDELVMTRDAPVQASTFWTPNQLANVGIISQQVADDFINANGEYQIEIYYKVVSSKWKLVASEASKQTFWDTTVTEYSFADIWHQEQLIGLETDVVTLEDSSSMELIDLASLTETGFSEAELTASGWAMPSNLDEFSENIQFRLAADIATFNVDSSGSNAISGNTFTWSLDAGSLVLVYPNGGTVRMTRYQDFAEIDEVLVVTDNADIKTSSYQMVAPFGGATLDPLMNQYAQNSFSLTNPNSYDSEGNLIADEVFGYRLQDNGIATRFWSGDVDLNNYQSGWDTWQLQWGDFDSAVMTSYLEEPNIWHSNCKINEWNCSLHRKRVWVPVQQVGDRVYVIEYEQRNSEAWNFGAEPSWYMAIQPRIQFYEVFDLGLDSDGDGTIDSQDDDIDGDNHNNDVDAFVFDSNEWADLDGDGIGDNSDWDLDNDGVANEYDAYPEDPNEWSDVDGDGIPDNQDSDRDNDGVLNGDDFAPLNPSITNQVTYVQRGKSNLDGPYHVAWVNEYRFYGNDSGDIFDKYLNNQVSTSYEFTYEGFTLDTGALPAASQWINTVYDLVNLGVIDQQSADDYVAWNGDLQDWEQVLVESSYQDFILVDDGVEEDTFNLMSTYRYRMANGDLHNNIIGPDSVEVPQPDEIVYMLDTEVATKLAFGHAELDAQSLSIVAFPGDELIADIFEFNNDGTGLAQIANVAFTWTEEADGSILMTYADIGDGRIAQVWLSAYEQFNEGYEVFVNAEIDGTPVVNYSYAVFDDGNNDLSAYIGQYLEGDVNHHTDYQDNGEHKLDIWGMQLNADGSVDNFSFTGSAYTDGDKFWTSTAPRYWEQAGDEFVITVRFQNGNFANCELGIDGCRESRRRTWTPIANDGTRVWVMEKEEWLDNVWENPGVEEEFWNLRIPPRVNVYQLRDINDGFSDRMVNLSIRNELGVNLDTPIDLTVITELNLSDYPISDLMGIEQLTNLEVINLENTQVTDLSPLFTMTTLVEVNINGMPLNDDTQIATLEGMGIIVFGTPITPISSLTFIDQELQNCVNDTGVVSVEELSYLDCSYRGLTDISDIDQLEFLQNITLNGNRDITDFSALALISSINNVDAWDTNFANSDFAAFAGHSVIGRFGIDSNLLTSIADAASMPSLHGLHLWTGQPYDLSVLVGLPAFNELALSADQVQDINVLNQLNLEYLWLNNELEQPGIDVLLGFNNLKHLSVGWNSYLSNNILAQLVVNNPELGGLGLEQTPITDLSYLFVNGEFWNDLVIPLNNINIDNLAVIDGSELQQQVQELMNRGVQVDGELAYGWLIADALAQINDSELKQCLIEHTQGMTVTGQLKELWCGSRNIHDIWGLWVFDNLRALDLSNNPIMDLGGELNSMQQLQQLYINDTLVTDINTLWNNPQLTYVGVNNLPLSDPDQVNTLPGHVTIDGAVLPTVEISGLTFNDTQLQQCVADNSAGLTNVVELTHLGCDGYNINDISDINQLTNLYWLSLLENSGISDLSSLTQIKSLTNLNVSGLQLEDGQLENIANITRLEDLAIGNNDTLTHLGPLANARQLRGVHLWGSNVYDLTPITNLPSLQMVALDYSQLGNSTDIFAQMPALRNLYLNGDVPYAEFETLMMNVSLESLNQAWSSLFDSSYLQLVIAYQPNIVSLGIDNNLQLSDITGVEVLTQLDNITINHSSVSSIQPLIDLRLAQDALIVNDEWHSRLNYVNVDSTPLADDSQIATLQNLGVNVDGSPVSGVLISTLNFTDPALSSCVQDQGVAYTGQLTQLECSYRTIVDISGIEQLTFLEWVSLNGNRDIADFSALTLLPSLNAVELWDTNFSSSDFAAFIGHGAINHLGTDSALLTSIAGADTMPNLASLHLWTGQVYDLSVLTGLANFNTLALSRDQVLDLNVLTQLTSLQNLWLNNELSPADEAVLLSLTGLNHLSVGWNSYLTNDILAQLVMNNPMLDGLGLEHTPITDLSSLFVDGFWGNDLVIPLTNINVEYLAAVDGSELQQQVQALMDKGVNVQGELVYGELISSVLNNIQDPVLKSCLTDNTQGLIVTGQLDSLWCDGANISSLSGIEAFFNLRELHLEDTAINSLWELGGMENLRLVYLNNSQVRDLNPIVGNPNIEFLAVANLPLEDPAQVDTFAGLTLDGVVKQDLITNVVINDPGLAQCFLDHSGGLTYVAQLHYMGCDNNYAISDLTDITQLYALDNVGLNDDGDNQISINDYLPLSQLPQLQWLRLNNNVLFDDTVAANSQIGALPKLMDIDLGGTSVTNLGIFDSSLHLEFMHLWGSTKFDLSPLSVLPKLSGIALSSAQLDSSDVNVDAADLLELQALTSLHLHGAMVTIEPTDTDPIDVIAQLTQLKGLSIGFDASVDNVAFAVVGDNLHGLDWLEVMDTSVSDLSPINALNRLTRLNLQQSTLVTDLSPIITLRENQDALAANDPWQPVLTDVDIFELTLTDASQITSLTNLGVAVSQ